MKKEQVKQKVAALVAAMREEAELKSQLMTINFVVASDRELDAAMRKQAELIRNLERLRNEKILPVVEEMAGFVGVAQKARGAAAHVAQPSRGTQTPARNTGRPPPPRPPTAGPTTPRTR